MKKITLLLFLLAGFSFIFSNSYSSNSYILSKEKYEISTQKQSQEIDNNQTEKTTFWNRATKTTRSIFKKPLVDQIVLVILAIFIPPLAVFLKEQLSTNFWIDLILTFLFFFPGIIFALLVVLDVI